MWWFDDDKYCSATSPIQPAILFPYAAGVKTFPSSGYFKILGTKLLYQSPWIPEIWNLDVYTYSAPKWYANEVKTDGCVKGWIHDRMIGSFQYQDYAKTVVQESYARYDAEGNNIQTKSSLGSSWVYTGSHISSRSIRMCWLGRRPSSTRN